MSNVVVVGGGVIGLSCAVELAKRGVSVTVIDKGEIGHGCSYGNAGWMTPCFAMPLPMPGLFFKSLKWLANPNSPLYIKPSPSLLLAKWMTQFLLAMNDKQAKAAIEALVLLSKVSLDEYEKLAKEFPEIGFEQKGLLMVSQTDAGVAAAVEEMHLVADYGVPGKQMSGEEIKNFEPALHGPLKGGVFFSKEAHGEPLKIVQALATKAKALGVKILSNTTVMSMPVENGKITTLKTSEGDIKADQVILATGSWSTALAKELGLSVPILGGKGYAMITPKLEKQPERPLMLVEKKIAITPRGNSLRIAGTLELVNQDFNITQRRVENIKRGAKEFLTIPENIQYQEVWRGLRPCTPDGVPLIGFTEKIPNLMLACGHQMLGLQSGYGTGILVADLMTKGKSDLNRAVYNPDRF